MSEAQIPEEWEAAPEPGWVDRALAEEFPGLSIMSTTLSVGAGRSPQALKERLRALSDRFGGAQAIQLRQQAIPWAYRVFFRHIGLDPDRQPTPIEELALERMRGGHFKSQNRVNDSLVIAMVESGVSIQAFDADRIEGRLGLRLSEDGEGFEAMVERVARSDALLVIPWGFGKWLGRRGAAVRAALERLDRRTICVGDNGGRLEWSREPRLMREARAKGFRVVPGSDPFPFGGDYRRVGRFGLCLDMSPPRVGLWRSIRTLLTGDSPPPRSYGRRVYPARFLFNNVAVQLVRRLKPGLS